MSNSADPAPDNSTISRRDFVRWAAVTGLVSALGDVTWGEETRQGDMIYRTLGKTGQKVSVIGVGGFHSANFKDPQETTKMIRTAIDRGVTFMDNSWDYHDGDSEARMGNALRDGYSEKVILMTKIDGRTKISDA